MNRQNTVQQLEAKLRENPNALVFARLADLYLQEKRFDEAINLCLKGLKAHSGYITGNFVLGKAFMAKGDFEKAEAEFKKVLTYDRTFLAAHKILGDLMAQMGWENKALIHYRNLLSTDPLDEDVRQMIDTMAPFETSFLSEHASTGFENAAEEKPWTAELEEVFNIELEKPSTGSEPPATPSADDSLNDFNLEEMSLSDSFGEEKSGDIEIQEPLDESPVSENASEKTDDSDEPDLLLDIENISDDQEKPLFDLEDKTAEPESELSDTQSPTGPAEDRLFDPEDDLIFSPLKTEEESDDAPSASIKEETTEPVAWEESILEEGIEEEKSEHQAPYRDPGLENEIIETIQELGENQSDSETPAETTPEEKTPSEPAKSSTRPSSQKKIVSTTLGDIFAAQGQFDKALEVYETLLASDPQNKRFLDKIAELKRKIREAGL
ncbi:MAG TPA: tetratricopeptide repeat protein [bacterium]|nr:tetratricopeptide repeat protein [bacterium]